MYMYMKKIIKELNTYNKITFQHGRYRGGGLF